MKAVLCVSVAFAVALPISLRAAGRDLGWTSSSRWSMQTRPQGGPPRAIGFYSAGCIQGAVALPPTGTGFEVLHLGRRRYFGHPVLVDYVRRLAAAAAARRFPDLLVGDLSQARGGPTPTDHGSHQSGLDVDIAYTRPIETLSRPLDPTEREGLQPPAVVDLATQRLTWVWNARMADLLEIAASDPAVDRIFVNAVVKRELCAHQKLGSLWLARLRPWWGHHDHFHVRLKCPHGSADCRPQPPVPPGEGCGLDLAWWLTDDARAAGEKRARTVRSPVGRRSPLPARCKDVLR
jgi:penicillin-insensitive murein endopeptidase